MRRPRSLALILLSLAAGCVRGPAANASESGWRALRTGGAVALLRHARAPGIGDPPQFKLEDCSTQRNLSDYGREQARAVGARFRAHEVRVERVLSSQWCRCLETVKLAFGDNIEPFPPLNSFLAKADSESAQTRALRKLVEGWRSRDGVLALVTHQVNITALTSIFPEEGEILVLRPKDSGSGFEVLARIKP